MQGFLLKGRKSRTLLDRIQQACNEWLPYLTIWAGFHFSICWRWLLGNDFAPYTLVSQGFLYQGGLKYSIPPKSWYKMTGLPNFDPAFKYVRTICRRPERMSDSIFGRKTASFPSLRQWIRVVSPAEAEGRRELVQHGVLPSLARGKRPSRVWFRLSWTDGPHSLLWRIAPPALAVSAYLRDIIAIPAAPANIFLNVYVNEINISGRVIIYSIFRTMLLLSIYRG